MERHWSTSSILGKKKEKFLNDTIAAIMKRHSPDPAKRAEVTKATVTQLDLEPNKRDGLHADSARRRISEVFADMDKSYGTETLDDEEDTRFCRTVDHPAHIQYAECRIRGNPASITPGDLVAGAVYELSNPTRERILALAEKASVINVHVDQPLDEGALYNIAGGGSSKVLLTPFNYLNVIQKENVVVWQNPRADTLVYKLKDKEYTVVTRSYDTIFQGIKPIIEAMQPYTKKCYRIIPFSPFVMAVTQLLSSHYRAVRHKNAISLCLATSDKIYQTIPRRHEIKHILMLCREFSSRRIAYSYEWGENDKNSLLYNYLMVNPLTDSELDLCMRHFDCLGIVLQYNGGHVDVSKSLTYYKNQNCTLNTGGFGGDEHIPADYYNQWAEISAHVLLFDKLYLGELSCTPRYGAMYRYTINLYALAYVHLILGVIGRVGKTPSQIKILSHEPGSAIILMTAIARLGHFRICPMFTGTFGNVFTLQKGDLVIVMGDNPNNGATSEKIFSRLTDQYKDITATILCIVDSLQPLPPNKFDVNSEYADTFVTTCGVGSHIFGIEWHNNPDAHKFYRNKTEVLFEQTLCAKIVSTVSYLYKNCMCSRRIAAMAWHNMDWEYDHNYVKGAMFAHAVLLSVGFNFARKLDYLIARRFPTRCDARIVHLSNRIKECEDEIGYYEAEEIRDRSKITWSTAYDSLLYLKSIHDFINDRCYYDRYRPPVKNNYLSVLKKLNKEYLLERGSNRKKKRDSSTLSEATDLNVPKVSRLDDNNNN